MGLFLDTPVARQICSTSQTPSDRATERACYEKGGRRRLARGVGESGDARCCRHLGSTWGRRRPAWAIGRRTDEISAAWGLP